MGLFKSKGKHAQKAYTLSEVVEPEKAEEAAEAEAAADAAEEAVEDAAEAQPDTAEAADEENAAEHDTEAKDEGVAKTADETAADETEDGEAGEEAAEEPFDPTNLDNFKDPETGAYVPVTSEGVVLQKKTPVGKVVGITCGTIIGVLLVAYIAGAVVFMGRFLPNTTVAGQDISMMPNEEVAQLLDDMVDNYSLDITGTEFNYHADAKDVGLSVDSQGVVDAMHADLNPWTWPALLAQDSHDETDVLTVSYDTKKYDYKVVRAVSEFNKEAVAPTDATIAYNEELKKFTIVEEVPGTQYDSHAVLADMNKAVASLEPKVKLTSDDLIQPNVFRDDERLVTSAEMATGLVSAHVTLTMAGMEVAKIDGSNLSQFIRMDENMGVTLDDAALDEWITNLSNSFDTVGSERTYTRPDGKEITISGGAYGWITDASGLKDQVVEAVKSGQTVTVDIPCEQEAKAYNGPGKPDWGNRYIDVDLSEQYVRFYGDDGSIIWESACISGSPDGEHNTWPGVWYITNKESPSKLIGYLPSGQKEYETTVSYWMAFEGNGIGLHDATWQPAFGGSMYAEGYGSHGCVNLPYDAAASLYDIAEWGEVVIAHY